MQGSKRVTVSGFTALALVFMMSAAEAAPITTTWQGDGGNDFKWGRNGNWDNGRPDNGGGDNYTAVIDNGETVQMDRDSDIDALVLGQTTPSGLTIESSRTLGLVNGTSSIGTDSTLQIEPNGRLNNQAGSTIINDGTIDNDGDLTNGGTIENAGTVNLNAGSTLDNTGGTISNNSGGVINANALLTFGDAATGTIALNSGGTFNVGSTTVTNAQFDSLGNDNTLTNGGTLNINGTFQNDGTLDNTGALNVNTGGTLNIANTINNTGTLTLNADSTFDNTGGRLNNNDGGEIILNTDLQIDPGNNNFAFNDNSTLMVNSGSTLSIVDNTGQSFLRNSFGDITGGGNIVIGSTGHSLSVLYFVGDGKLDLSNGINPDGTLSLQDNGRLSFNVTSQLAGGTVQTENRTLIEFTQEASMTGGTVTNNATMKFDNDASMTGGTVTNNDFLDFAGASQMSGGTVNNNWEINLVGSSEITGGTVNNEANGKLYVNDTAQISGNAIINNKSGAEVTFSGTSATERAKMTGGTITNTQGTVNFDNNSELAGGTVDNAQLGGGVRFFGNAIMSSGLLKSENNADTFFEGSSELSGGTVENTGTGNLFFENSATMSGGAVTNNSTLDLVDNSQILGGTVTNNSGGIISLKGSSTISADAEVTNSGGLFLFDTSQISGGTVTNDNQMQLSGTSSISGGTVTNNDEVAFGFGTSMTGGELINNGTATFDSNSISNATLTNNGTVIASGGLNVSSSSVTNALGSQFTLNGLGEFSGSFVNNGTVSGSAIFNGDVSGSGVFEGITIFNGTTRPGNSPGLLTGSELFFGASNTLEMEVGGYERGTEYDAIDAFSVTLGGLLDVALLDLSNGFSPMAGDTFDLIIADTIMGAFSSFSFATLLDGLYFSTNLIIDEFGSDIFQLVVLAESTGEGVPGPGAVFILVIGLAGFGALRRRGL